MNADDEECGDIDEVQTIEEAFAAPR